MKRNTKTFRVETLVLGKWLVASRGVSAVEADAIRQRFFSDPTVRVLPE